METLKPLVWMGASRKELALWPRAARDELSYALFLAQIGKRHQASRVLPGVGDACELELIASRARRTHRAVYAVRFAQAIFVLHVFQTKPRQGFAPSTRDLDLIAIRLWRAAELAKESKR